MNGLFLQSVAVTTNTSSLPTTNIPQRVANSDAARILSSISASLSILGTVAIIITYFLWKEIQTNSRLILVYISIADFFTAAGNLFSLFYTVDLKNLEDPTCVVQSFVTTTSCLCSFFWTTYLGLYLFLTVARRQTRIADNLMLVFHITAWGIPLAIVTTALLEHKLGDDLDYVTGGWCWINGNVPDRVFWMLVTGKAWELGSYLLITVLFVVVKCHIQSEIRHRRQTFITNSSLLAAQKADRKLSFVPLAFVLLRIWGTIRFFIYVCYPGSVHDTSLQNDLSFLVYFQGIGDLGQGFTNFLLFCFLTEKFQVRFRRLLTSQCCRVCRRKQQPHHTQVSDAASNSSVVQTAKGHENPIVRETSPLLGHNPPRSP